MPPRPPLDFAARLEFLYTVTDESGGHQPANIMYVSYPDADPAASDLVTLAGQIRAAWGTHIMPLVHADVSLTQTVLTRIDGTEVQGIDTTAVAGGNGTTSLMPPHVAACISWHINRAYRGGHPRTYLSGMTQGDLVGSGWNLLTTSYAGTLATAAAAFVTAVNALTVGGFPVFLGTVSYTAAKVLRDPPVFFDYVAAGTRVNTRLATQRRRLGKLSVGAYET